jgi:hypothetical protein
VKPQLSARLRAARPTEPQPGRRLPGPPKSTQPCDPQWPTDYAICVVALAVVDLCDGERHDVAERLTIPHADGRCAAVTIRLDYRSAGALE